MRSERNITTIEERYNNQREKGKSHKIVHGKFGKTQMIVPINGFDFFRELLPNHPRMARMSLSTKKILRRSKCKKVQRAKTGTQLVTDSSKFCIAGQKQL